MSVLHHNVKFNKLGDAPNLCHKIKVKFKILLNCIASKEVKGSKLVIINVGQKHIKFPLLHKFGSNCKFIPKNLSHAS